MMACEQNKHASQAARSAVRIGPGSPLPLGVRDCCDGFNFAVFSRHARAVELLLFEDVEADEPFLVVSLDSPSHRTGDIWHVLLDGVEWGQAYAWRVHGPFDPARGHRFDNRRWLLDPYTVAVGGTERWNFARLTSEAGNTDRNAAPSAKCVLVSSRFDWQGVSRPARSWPDTVIYETHVRGLTIHPSARAAHPGTFLGVIEKIPYLLELGVTAVELMPVQEFNERDNPRRNPTSGAPLRNYWGYSSAAFFAPKAGYATGSSPECQVSEFKTMVRELHRAGIEIILDVVFNHTAEGDERGPTLNFRGLDNAIYYMLADDRRHYRNYTGCGNTLNCNHPVVRDYIIDCLRYWATEMQVDGFRFDLASVLGRDARGELLPNPPLLERIAEDPILRDVKLIAEAWDAGGAFQVGSFPGQRWAEWNARFRDDVRRFWRGDPGMIGALAWRLCGSADLYERDGKAPVNGINFVTCHDGFTLNDLVSYAAKHNEANGEEGRDGSDANFSANHGVEGETDDSPIEALRLRQIKNMLATLLLSRGVPMLLGGDEFRRTQQGNNNAYCQDNELSWYDWGLLDRNRELFRFVRQMIAFRRQHPVLRADAFYTKRDVRWFDTDGYPPDWSGVGRTLGCAITPDSSEELPLCVLFNADTAPVTFAIPPSPEGTRWYVRIDTTRTTPGDIGSVAEEESRLATDRDAVQDKSMVVLCADR